MGIDELGQIMAASRDAEELKRVWVGWHQISKPYRKNYQRFVELSNKGAREMGFADTGAMWRSPHFREAIAHGWHSPRPSWRGHGSSCSMTRWPRRGTP